MSMDRGDMATRLTNFHDHVEARRVVFGVPFNASDSCFEGPWTDHRK